MTTPATDRDPRTERRVPRRRVLAAAGTAATAGLAGCGALCGGPRSLNPPDVVEDRPTTRVWEFPRDASDANTPVQVYLDQHAPVPADAASADVQFRFGVSVFEHTPYRHDRITLRVAAPAHPEGNRPPASVFVEPPGGGFTSFRTYRDGRETVLSLTDLSETGTLEFGFVLDPGASPTPETLGYAFEVGAANTDVGGSAAVATADGAFDIAVEEQ